MCDGSFRSAFWVGVSQTMHSPQCVQLRHGLHPVITRACRGFMKLLPHDGVGDGRINSHRRSPESPGWPNAGREPVARWFIARSIAATNQVRHKFA